MMQTFAKLSSLHRVIVTILVVIGFAVIVGYSSFGIGYSQGVRLGEATVTVTTTVTQTIKDPVTMQSGVYLEPLTALIIVGGFIMMIIVNKIGSYN